MPTVLLDVNVLLALAWPGHPHRHVAHRWLKESGADFWATCPITECGFVRVSSTPKAIIGAVTPASAIKLLVQVTHDPRHLFWHDEISLAATPLRHTVIQGHKQVTDAYLLSLAIARGGKLVTFDQGVPSLASTDAERASIIVVTAQ